MIEALVVYGVVAFVVGVVVAGYYGYHGKGSPRFEPVPPLALVGLLAGAAWPLLVGFVVLCLPFAFAAALGRRFARRVD